ncbi:MAG: hypothetical protein N2508_13520 [Anaerolineae bacterium]|nr:hypothetical protein [Anaerolineae bacterium]
MALVATLTIGLARLHAPSPVLAQSADLAMDVRVGFDGYCHASDRWGWCPLRIVVSNEGTDIEGEIRVSTIDPSADVYAVPALLPSHSRKAFYIYIPTDHSSSRLSVRLYDGNKEVLSQQVPVAAWLAQDELLYGIASSRPSAFNFLSSIAPDGGRAVVAHLDLTTLPPNPLGWESLDVLILDDTDTAALDEERRQALETWVAHGGRLIVGGGAGAYRTAAGIAHLLPVTLGGTQTVEGLEALGEWTATAVQPGPYAVATASIRDGEVVVRQGDCILWARRSHGAGRVDFLAFEASLNPFTQWSGQERLWSAILAQPHKAQTPITFHNAPSVYSAAASAIPGLALPSVAQVAIFLLSYILLIGPLNYLVLRKLNRRELAWFTIPALIFGFTAFAYLTGLRLRGDQAVAHQSVIIYVPQGADTGRASSVTALFSPRRAAYEVAVADALIRRLPETGEIARPLHIYQDQNGSRVRRLLVDIGGIRPLVAEEYVAVSEVRADLKVISSTGNLMIEGSILNGEQALSDAILLAGRNKQYLGKLPAGDTAQVSILYDELAHSALPSPILGPGYQWEEDQDLHRHLQFLQAILQHDSQSSEIYLLGWADPSPFSVEVVARPYQATSEVLYIYHLSLEALQVGKEMSIPPWLFERQVDSQSGEVFTWGSGFSMHESSQLVLRFSLWPWLVVQQAGRLVLNIQGSGNGMPTVSLWNKDTATWEVVSVSWGSNVFPEGETYVQPPGTIMVKLETGVRQQVEIGDVTVSLAGRR